MKQLLRTPRHDFAVAATLFSLLPCRAAADTDIYAFSMMPFSRRHCHVCVFSPLLIFAAIASFRCRHDDFPLCFAAAMMLIFSLIDAATLFRHAADIDASHILMSFAAEAPPITPDAATPRATTLIEAQQQGRYRYVHAPHC